MALVGGLLGTILLGGRVASVMSTVGTNLLVSTFTHTSNSMASTIVRISSYDQPGVKEIYNSISELDLQYRIKVIHSLILRITKSDENQKLHITNGTTEFNINDYINNDNQIVNKKIICNHDLHINASYMSDDLKYAIIGVWEILNMIVEELDKIDTAIKEHGNKYLSSFRSLNCKNNIKTLKRYSTLLDNRFNMLKDVSKMQ